MHRRDAAQVLAVALLFLFFLAANARSAEEGSIQRYRRQLQQRKNIKKKAQISLKKTERRTNVRGVARSKNKNGEASAAVVIKVKNDEVLGIAGVSDESGYTGDVLDSRGRQGAGGDKRTEGYEKQGKGKKERKERKEKKKKKVVKGSIFDSRKKGQNVKKIKELTIIFQGKKEACIYGGDGEGIDKEVDAMLAKDFDVISIKVTASGDFIVENMYLFDQKQTGTSETTKELSKHVKKRCKVTEANFDLTVPNAPPVGKLGKSAGSTLEDIFSAFIGTTGSTGPFLLG